MTPLLRRRSLRSSLDRPHRPRRQPWARAAAVAALIAATAAVTAVVHAALLRTEPAIGSTVSSAPEVVRLFFSEAVEATTDPLIVLDPRGARVDEGGGVSPEDITRLEARVRDAGPGTYTVRWRAVSEDGHVVSDAYLYHVGYATRTDPAGEPTTPYATSLTVARAIHLAGLTGALGALVLALLIGAPTRAAVRTLAMLGAVGAAAIIVGASVDAWAQNVALGGKPAAGAISSGVVWGALWAARGVAGAGLLVLFTLDRAWALQGLRRSGALALVVVALVATALDGHALTTSPVWLSIPVQLLHLGATGAWLGGAVALWLVLRRARATHGANGAVVVDAMGLVRRFSKLAFGCIVALILTGLYQSWSHIARLAMLGSTFYGRTLLVKVALLALVAIPASVNRWVVKPRLAATAQGATDHPALLGRLTRLLGFEVALGALILIAGAMLASLPPPVDTVTPVTAAAATPPAR